MSHIITYPNSPFKLYSDFKPAGDQPLAIQKLTDGLTQGLDFQTLLGVTGSGKTFTMANIIAQSGRPAIIMTPNKTLTAQLFSEMKAYFPENAVEYFVSYYDYYQPEAYVPSKDLFIEKDSVVNEQIEQMRLSATKAVLERDDCIIIASVSAIYGMGDVNAYQDMILHVQTGMNTDRDRVIRRLVDMQYERNDIDFKRGTFRIRGDQIDVFPAEHADLALRIDLFDDEIDKLSLFDPLTGKVKNNIKKFTIYPSSHYVTPKEIIHNATEKIKLELQERLDYFSKNFKFVEAQRLEQRIHFDLEMMNEIGFCKGIEHYTRYLTGREEGSPPPTLLEYFPKNSLVFVDESHVTFSQIAGMSNGDRQRKQNLVDYGFRLPSALDNRPLRFDEFEHLANTIIAISATPSDYELERSKQIVEQIVRPTGLLDPTIEIHSTEHQVDDLSAEIQKCVNRKERVLVTTLTKRMAEELSAYFDEHGIKAKYLHSDIDSIERVSIIKDLRLGLFDVLVGINLLREGLDIPEVSLVAILDADKEGFLRSERSLIQTMGRSARNANGRVILYADKITPSMQRAIDETQRRREKQALFNQQNGIIPKTINKRISDLLEDTGITPATDLQEQSSQLISNLDLKKSLTEKQLSKKIKQLEKQMKTLAQELKFEEAMQIREQIKLLIINN